MLLDHLDDAHALLLDASSDKVVTAGSIRERAALVGQSPRGLFFLVADGTVESAHWFLALLEARHPVALIDPGSALPAAMGLIDRYRPDCIVDPGGRYLGELLRSPQGAHGRLVEPGVWVAWERGPTPHDDLAVLLTTSGSTGSPKLVRLSAENIKTNAQQIVESLGITADDRGVTALPLFYSFGMSVLTSHVLAGSSVLVTGRSVLEEPFWTDAERHRVSFLPGVPTSYAMLKRLGFERRGLSQLRVLTQAGGRLAPELVSFFHDLMTSRGGRFCVMYGQTEASPRMSCMPSERLREKRGSVGPALPGGVLSIRGDDGHELPVGEIGEVIYRGPNVMMGYAESREDLVLGDTHGAVLATGDLGYLDDEGFLFLAGRSMRICKLSGSRVSLDEIEDIAVDMLPGDGQVAAVDCGDAGVSVFATRICGPEVAASRAKLARRLGVPPKLIVLLPVDAIPTLSNGKTDYVTLTRSLGSGGEPQ